MKSGTSKNRKFDTMKRTRTAVETMRTGFDRRIARYGLFPYCGFNLAECPAQFSLDIMQSDEIALRFLSVRDLPPELARIYHVAITFAEREHFSRRSAGVAQGAGVLNLRHVIRAVEQVGYRNLTRSRGEPDLIENTAAWIWLLITRAVKGDEPAQGGSETYEQMWARMTG